MKQEGRLVDDNQLGDVARAMLTAGRQMHPTPGADQQLLAALGVGAAPVLGSGAQDLTEQDTSGLLESALGKQSWGARGLDYGAVATSKATPAWYSVSFRWGSAVVGLASVGTLVATQLPHETVEAPGRSAAVVPSAKYGTAEVDKAPYPRRELPSAMQGSTQTEWRGPGAAPATLASESSTAQHGEKRTLGAEPRPAIIRAPIQRTQVVREPPVRPASAEDAARPSSLPTEGVAQASSGAAFQSDSRTRAVKGAARVEALGAPALAAPALAAPALAAPARAAVALDTRLAEETRRLDRARRALARRSYASALSELDAYDQAFPRGVLQPESVRVRKRLEQLQQRTP